MSLNTLFNTWCGSLDYQLEIGPYTMESVNRRDMADSIRGLNFSQSPPTEEAIKEFGGYMRGKDSPTDNVFCLDGAEPTTGFLNIGVSSRNGNLTFNF